MTEQNNETPLAQQAQELYDRQGEAAMLDFIQQHRALRRLALPAFSGEARLSGSTVPLQLGRILSGVLYMRVPLKAYCKQGKDDKQPTRGTVWTCQKGLAAVGQQTR